MKKHIQQLFLIIFVMQVGCRKFIDIPAPETQIIRNTVFDSDNTANAAMLSILSQLEVEFFLNEITTVTSLSSDEFKNYSTGQENIQIYTNAILPANGRNLGIWSQAYSLIYQCNAIMEGANASKKLSSQLKNQIQGEAKFLRAYLYFYLTNLYGDVPLVTETDYQINKKLSRLSSDTIYKYIVQDLVDARNLLTTSYKDANGIDDSDRRIRPNKLAAAALLARVHLYTKDYDKAETLSNDVINSNTYILEPDIDKVFLIDNKEEILQISNEDIFNTTDGYNFVLTARPGAQSIDPNFVHAFDKNDKRLLNWIGTYIEGTDTFYFPNKYKIQYASTQQESLSILRLSEQYLIRSEARIMQGNLSGGETDLNIVRQRAGLPPANFNSSAQALALLIQERRNELFVENGHRWLDLKRTGTVDDFMKLQTPSKGGTWKTSAQLYPIPQSERSKDPELSQNPGY